MIMRLVTVQMVVMATENDNMIFDVKVALHQAYVLR